MMAFAAYQVAMEDRCELVDVEFIRHQHHLRRCRLDGDHAMLEEDVVLPDLITITDHLSAHAPGFEADGSSRDKRGRSTPVVSSSQPSTGLWSHMSTRSWLASAPAP